MMESLSHKVPGMWDRATSTQCGPRRQADVLLPLTGRVWERTSSLLPSEAVLV